MMKKISINTIILFTCLYTHGQINIGGKPYSFEHDILAKAIIQNEIPQVELPILDFNKLSIEDSVNNLLGKPFRYGIPIKVNYDIDNSGKWIELENGDRIWKLEIHCPFAKSINLSYDKFWLPEGGLLYLYDKNKESFIGGISNKNNNGPKENPAKYTTGIILSDVITLEYYEPKNVRCEGIISISKIIYGYEEIGSLAESLCTVDINCSPEGDNWQDEKTSVALILMNGYLCTGSLIKNTHNNGIPYFLTADHCIETNNLDAISDPDATDFIFWWNYENLVCNGSIHPYTQTIGATVVANDDPVDFALLRLIESPYDLSPPIQAYFNGWDRQNQYYGSIGIHHPLFNPKKISTDEHLPTTSGTYYWKVVWDSTTNGSSITYEGSSGSPLFSVNTGRVIGQLYGASGDCDYQSNLYGKFSLSWNMGSEYRRRLRDWLDPDNSGVNYLNGSYCSGNEFIANTNFYSDTIVYGCTLNLQNVHIQNNADVVFNYFNEIIFNGEFEVELGSIIENK